MSVVQRTCLAIHALHRPMRLHVERVDGVAAGYPIRLFLEPAKQRFSQRSASFMNASGLPSGLNDDTVEVLALALELVDLAPAARRRPSPASPGRQQWDGPFVGRQKGNEFIYAGRVDHGLDKTSETEPLKRLKPLIRKTQPYSGFRTRASGWSRSSSPSSSIGASPPRVRSGTRSSKPREDV